jgi:tetratricopeptide (TPR) repeat protein
MPLSRTRKDQWDFAIAEREYRKALQLNSNLVEAHAGLAICLTVLGQYDAAIREVQRVLELDPISVQATIDTAGVLQRAPASTCLWLR